MRIGMPEVMILFVIRLVWLVPLVACVWAAVTLSRVRTARNDTRERLDSIERVIRGRQAL